jgi:hypothetical protein
MTSIIESALAAILEKAKAKISEDEIFLVEDNLPTIHEASSAMREDGYILRPLQELDNDEKKLFCYLYLNREGVLPKTESLRKIEESNLSILERMLNGHFLNLIKSEYIRKKVVGFKITKRFCLNAVLDDLESKPFEERFQGVARRGLKVFTRSLLVLKDMEGMWKDYMAVKEEVNNANKTESSSHESSSPKQAHPFVFSKDVEDYVRQVFSEGGSFESGRTGWHAKDKEGKHLSPEYPIPHSKENDEIIYRVFPGLRK